MNCIVCRTRPTNPMIGPIEPVYINGNLVFGNNSYCSQTCRELNNRIDLQFTPADRLAEMANRIHEQTNG